MIGAFTSAPAPPRRVIVDPGLLSTRDRAALRILYRSDVATTAQLTTLAYARRQTTQERLAFLYRAGYLERAILPPSSRGGAPFAFRISPRGRRRLGYDPLTRSRAGTQLRHSLNGVETVCALLHAGAGGAEPLVQAWLSEVMAHDLLPKVYPDAVVALQAATGSAVLCLEIDQNDRACVRSSGTSSAGTRRALRAKAGWHLLFVVPSAERAGSPRAARRTPQGGYPGSPASALGARPARARTRGLDARVVALDPNVARTTLGALLVDPTPAALPDPGRHRRLAPGPRPRRRRGLHRGATVRRESLTPSERVMRARMAAYMLHARYDPRETTKAARRAFNQRFVDQVDPDGRLPDANASAAPKPPTAYFTRLAYLSARSRRTRSACPAIALCRSWWSREIRDAESAGCTSETHRGLGSLIVATTPTA